MGFSIAYLPGDLACMGVRTLARGLCELSSLVVKGRGLGH